MRAADAWLGGCRVGPADSSHICYGAMLSRQSCVLMLLVASWGILKDWIHASIFATQITWYPGRIVKRSSSKQRISVRYRYPRSLIKLHLPALSSFFLSITTLISIFILSHSHSRSRPLSHT